MTDLGQQIRDVFRARMEARGLVLQDVRVRRTSAMRLLRLLNRAQQESERRGRWVTAHEVGKIAAQTDEPFFGSWLRVLTQRGWVEHKQVSLYRLSEVGAWLLDR